MPRPDELRRWWCDVKALVEKQDKRTQDGKHHRFDTWTFNKSACVFLVEVGVHFGRQLKIWKPSFSR